MSKPKKLDLTFEELSKIATAINQNTIANRTRSAKDKITIGKFLRDKFDIAKNSFSETIKDIAIAYNPTTFLYDIDVKEIKTTIKIIDAVKTVEQKEEIINPVIIESVPKQENNIEILGLKKVLSEVKELLEMKEQLKEVIQKYNENISIINVKDEQQQEQSCFFSIKNFSDTKK